MSYSVDAFSKQVFGRLGEIAIVSELPSNPSILWPNGIENCTSYNQRGAEDIGFHVLVVDQLALDPSLFYSDGVVVYDRNSRSFYRVTDGEYAPLPSLAQQYDSVLDMPGNAVEGSFAFSRGDNGIYRFELGSWVSVVAINDLGAPLSIVGCPSYNGNHGEG